MAPVVDTVIQSLGPCRHESPLSFNEVRGDRIGNFISDLTRIRHQVEVPAGAAIDTETFFEKAGARQRVFFDPRKIRAAIVTCGGLCPGLNNVIRSAFLELHHNYGVREVLGIRHGFQGLTFKTEPRSCSRPKRSKTSTAKAALSFPLRADSRKSALFCLLYSVDIPCLLLFLAVSENAKNSVYMGNMHTNGHKVLANWSQVRARVFITRWR